MLSIGFDPSFIDTLVRVQNGNSLATHLPLPGNHHRDSFIQRIAGGNGVNVSYVLSKIDIPHTLVVPVNQEFEMLLKQRGIINFYSINADISETVALTYSKGDIQFNHQRSVLNRIHWSKEIHDLWVNSPIAIFLNWGLNIDSLEWVSLQWLSICGWNFDELLSERDLFSHALEMNCPSKPIILEPGSIKTHHSKDNLTKLLTNMSKSEITDKLIFCCNEEEVSEYRTINFPNFVLHTSKFVELIGSEEKLVDVPKLRREPETFVGAGDAFLAGMISSVLKDEIDLDYCIKVAQTYLLNDYSDN
ncbi:MAG: hypothetical protein OEZ01_12795 [Candidatus Heimdallarchaeota archaeon]|nr:hypothetical protein [Candidatus Heimdallarchaeota archaeon]MDH5646884.1 hypothetical protein [Candidatus Heimdallarchaeota archaeon]